MGNSFKLGIVTDWGDKKSAFYFNKDGFLKMLHVLRERDGWDVQMFRRHPDRSFTWDHDYVTAHFSPDPAKELLSWNPDAILGFSDFSRPYLDTIRGKKPIALCYTGGRFTHYKDVPDIVFVESKTYVDWMKTMGLNVVQAFGTNTELFKPYSQPKIFDAFYPATFADWKRHDLFAEAVGSKGLVCGWHQSHEPHTVQVCIDNNVAVLHHQLPESVVRLYSMSYTTVVTAKDIGGCQRTVLESMACNIPVIAMADSTMTTEYIRECGIGEIVEPAKEQIRLAIERQKEAKDINSRDWILKNYSEYIYADKIKAGIKSIL